MTARKLKSLKLCKLCLEVLFADDLVSFHILLHDRFLDDLGIQSFEADSAFVIRRPIIGLFELFTVKSLLLFHLRHLFFLDALNDFKMFVWEFLGLFEVFKHLLEDAQMIRMRYMNEFALFIRVPQIFFDDGQVFTLK